MSQTIRDVMLPQLGMGMSEGTIVEWLVKEGAHVKRDAPLVSIETEKVVTELPAPSAGFLHILVQPGNTRPIETVIAKLATSEEAYRALASAAPEETPSPVAGPTAPGPLGAVAKPGRVIASGLAKALARLHGIDLTKVQGSGPRGRIVKRDVVSRVGRPPAAAPAAPVLASAVKATIPLAGMRRTIAERMVRSSTEAAQTFVFFDVDVTDLLRARERIDARVEEGAKKTTALAYYAKAVALACKRVPIANATLVDGVITLWNEVNIGVAVALPGATEYDSSLIVPVVHRAETMGVAGLSQAIRGKVQLAREGKLTASDLAGGTITISSSAGFASGMWAFSTPLLNLPQAVIFQPGNAVKRPVVIDDQIVIRTILPCSLTFDHRCLDGEPVARFVRELSGFLSQPETMLM